MFLIIITQVTLRYTLSQGFSWAEEVTVFLMAWMTFRGSAIAVKQAEHIKIDMVVDKLPEILRRIVNISSKLFILVFFLILTYFGFQFAVGSLKSMCQVILGRLITPISLALYFCTLFHYRATLAYCPLWITFYKPRT